MDKRRQLAAISPTTVLAFALLVLATGLADGKETADDNRARLYHWPYLKFTSYTNALGEKQPTGDISPERAFYWGRVIGCDGVAFNIRGLSRALEEGNWFEPVYRSLDEKSRLFRLMKGFQSVYAKYGCDDNFLHLHAHPLLQRHPTHVAKDVAQWRRWVLAGMRQRAELLQHLGTTRILIDLEFASQPRVSKTESFWYELGRDVSRTMVRQHPRIRIGFYPGLYYHLSRQPPKKLVLENVAAGDLRHAFLKGLYAGRGKHPLWYFSGYTYSIVDGTVAKKGAKYVWDLAGHLRGLMQVHRRALGGDLEFMPGRWDLGKTQRPSQLFGGLFKQPNLSLNMMRRDYKLLLRHTKMIGVWDHGWSWDRAGAGYKRFQTDADLANWKASLGKASLSSRYHKHLKTKETWHIQLTKAVSLERKLRLFRIVKASDGGWLVSGKLASNFTEYVNLAQELTGKNRVVFPLYSQADVVLVKKYMRQGFFPKRRVTIRHDQRWPQSMATVAPH